MKIVAFAKCTADALDGIEWFLTMKHCERVIEMTFAGKFVMCISDEIPINPRPRNATLPCHRKITQYFTWTFVIIRSCFSSGKVFVFLFAILARQHISIAKCEMRMPFQQFEMHFGRKFNYKTVCRFIQIYLNFVALHKLIYVVQLVKIIVFCRSGDVEEDALGATRCLWGNSSILCWGNST